MKIREKITNPSSNHASNTILPAQFKNLKLKNGRIIDQTADILQEGKEFYENLYTSKFQMGNTMYHPQYEQEFFQQSGDIL